MNFFGSIEAGELRAFTSELTLAEVLVRPLMDRNLERQAYKQPLSQTDSLAAKQ